MTSERIESADDVPVGRMLIFIREITDLCSVHVENDGALRIGRSESSARQRHRRPEAAVSKVRAKRAFSSVGDDLRPPGGTAVSQLVVSGACSVVKRTKVERFAEPPSVKLRI